MLTGERKEKGKRPALQTQEDRLRHRNEIRRHLLINLGNVAETMRQKIKTIGDNHHHQDDDDTWSENDVKQGQEFAAQMDQYHSLLDVKDVDDETDPISIADGIVQAVQSLPPEFLARCICTSNYMMSLFSRLNSIASESYTPTDADVAYILATRRRRNFQEETLSVSLQTRPWYLFRTTRVKRLHFWTQVIVPASDTIRRRRLVPAVCCAPSASMAKQTFPEHMEISTILYIADLPQWIKWCTSDDTVENGPQIVEMWLEQQDLRHCAFVLVLTNLSALRKELSRAAGRKALARLFPDQKSVLLPSLDEDETACVDKVIQNLLRIFTDLNAHTG
jgi:hypothetical protein